MGPDRLYFISKQAQKQGFSHQKTPPFWSGSLRTRENSGARLGKEERKNRVKERFMKTPLFSQFFPPSSLARGDRVDVNVIQSF